MTADELSSLGEAPLALDDDAKVDFLRELARVDDEETRERRRRHPPELRAVSIAGGYAAIAWARLLESLEVPEAAFGPECREPRPRPAERFWLAIDVDRAPVGRECGQVLAAAAGLIYTRAPAPSTRTFGLGLYPAYRGRGLGKRLRDLALELAFADPDVDKVETDIYSSNPWSMQALRDPGGGPMVKEGRQRRTIMINGVAYDRILLGLTRSEWTAWRARR
jgi:RimJ/RimL family protein N-acetyltransferase